LKEEEMFASYTGWAMANQIKETQCAVKQRPTRTEFISETKSNYMRLEVIACVCCA
jgi:hypothetical protein